MGRKVLFFCLLTAGALFVKPCLIPAIEKEPQGINPKDISAITEELTPNKGVEIMIRRRWSASGWAGDLQAKTISLGIEDGFPQFTVGDPNLRSVWVYYLNLPIDFNLYPVVVLKYRAKNISPRKIYTLWLDDGTGPNHGGIYLISELKTSKDNELITDGEVHVIRKDLRDFNPKGAITGFALGVMCGDTTPAVFDLVALNFEAAPDKPLKEAPKNDTPFKFLVVNAKGQPIKEARVIIDAERANFSRTGFTDENGICEVTPLKNESGKHMVRVEVDGMSPVECPDVKKDRDKPLKIIVQVKAGEENERARSSRAAASFLETSQKWIAGETGTIFMKFVAPNQTPLLGNKARIARTQDNSWDEVGVITSDKDGLASFAVPLGQITIMQEDRVTIPGWYIPENHYSFQLKWAKEQWQYDNRYGILPTEALYQFAGGTGTEKDPVVIKVGAIPAMPVAGIVVDNGGNPVQNCTVYSGFARNGVQSDAEGKFIFPVLPDKKKIELLAMSSDRKLAGAASFEKESAGPLKITVQPTKNYPGKVVDCEGIPVGKISFYADLYLDSQGIYKLRQEVVTDGESRFTLNNAYPGSTYHFWWSGDDKTNRDFDYGNAEVKLSDISEEKTLAITAKRHIECLMGKVADSEGKPVKGANVAIQSWDLLPQDIRMNQKPTITDEKGEFTIGRLAKGKISLRITHPDYKGILMSGIPTDSIDAVGILKPKGAIVVSARVKDLAGNPVPGTTFTVFETNPYKSLELGDKVDILKLERKTDAQGICKITIPEQKDKKPVTWSFLCDAPGYYSFFSGLYGDTDSDLEITLKKQEGEDGNLKGHVTGMDGKPVKGAIVRALYISSSPQGSGGRGGSSYPEEIISAVTDSDGRFTFPKISREDSVNLEVYAEGYAKRSFYSRMQQSKNEITVQLPPPCEISGVVLYEDTEKPAEGIVVSANSRSGDEHGICRTGGDGKYSLKNLPEGAYYLKTIFLPSLPNKEPPEYVITPYRYDSVETEPAKPVTGKDFLLKKGLIVSGRVVEKSTGKTLADMYISCYSGGPPQSGGIYCGNARTDSEGRYKITLLPGKIFFQFHKQGVNTPQSRELLIEEGKSYNNIDFYIDFKVE